MAFKTFAGKIRTRSECVKEFSNTDLKDSLTAVVMRWTATGADLQGHLDLQKDTRILCTVYMLLVDTQSTHCHRNSPTPITIINCDNADENFSETCATDALNFAGCCD